MLSQAQSYQRAEPPIQSHEHVDILCVDLSRGRDLAYPAGLGIWPIPGRPTSPSRRPGTKESQLMLISLAALLALATPASSPPPVVTTAAVVTTAGCFGPCHVPGCPNSTFWICHETSGKTTIYAESGGAKSSTTRDNDTASQTSALGAMVGPKPGETWGSVANCTDLQGWY